MSPKEKRLNDKFVDEVFDDLELVKHLLDGYKLQELLNLDMYSFLNLHYVNNEIVKRMVILEEIIKDKQSLFKDF